MVTFTAGSGAWAVPDGVGSVEVLVAGGGGGGGTDNGGGGGAGGLIYQAAFAVAGGASVPVAVGAGGAGGYQTDGYYPALNGDGSVFASLVAAGGGRGAGYQTAEPHNYPGGAGGSGGGGYPGFGGGAPGSGTPGLGYGGGATAANNAGGGGGAGGEGRAGSPAGGGDGGAGLAFSLSGATNYYAGGGGAGANGAGGSGSGGLGGGGGGASGGQAAGAGLANTGGGGGGSHNAGTSLGGAGGSGVVIVSYPTCPLISRTTFNGASTVVTFTSGSGTWKVPDGVRAVDVLVVGGGGGGGTDNGGGGGAGGVVHQAAFAVAGGASVPVAVGAGGAGGYQTDGYYPALNGDGSVFASLVAAGGGRGAGYQTAEPHNYPAGAGGSGGGGYPGFGGGAPGGGIPGQGCGGGAFDANNAGGGGGAGGEGRAGSPAGGGDGGAGLAFSLSGATNYYAGGGGAGANGAGGAGSGGLGGGGGGASGGQAAGAGAANTGGGGGGSHNVGASLGGAGGSGVVIVSYSSSPASMYLFGLPDRLAVIAGTVIDWTVPFGTDVTALAPTFTLFPGATCDKASGSTQNFTTPQTYTVISADAAVTNVYTVTVTCKPRATLKLVPWPAEVREDAGAFPLRADTRIIPATPDLTPLAVVLMNDFANAFRQTLAVDANAQAAGNILLRLSSALTGEAYRVTVTTNGALVEAGTYAALAAASASLLQAVAADGAEAEIPCLSISDAPSVAYRGLMIDVARAPHGVATLKRLIQLCRLYKIRYLQLHLTDDQGIKFPSSTFPLLTTSNSSGRAYTLEELRDLERYSQDRGVTIIPEFDVPGHSAALIRTMPDLFKISGTTPYEHDNTINWAKPEVMAALDVVIGEICAVFQATPYFHVGGDEANYALAHQNAAFVQRFQELGYAEPYDVADSHQLYRRLLRTLNDSLAAKYGKQMLCWEGFNRDLGDPPLEPLPKTIPVMAFENTYYPADLLVADGYPVINSAWNPLYVVNEKKVSPENIYAWNICRFGLYQPDWSKVQWVTVPEGSNVIGAQMCAWEQSESVQLESLRLRLAAMSERIWNPGAGKTFADFSLRVAETDSLLTRLTAVVEPPAPAVPTGLVVTAGNRRADLAWNAVAYATGYTAMRSASSGGPYAVISQTAAPNFTDAPLTNGELYWYVVSATNVTDASADSAPACVRPLPPTAPPPVLRGFSASLGAGATFAFDGMGGIRYRILHSEDLLLPRAAWPAVTPPAEGWTTAPVNGPMTLTAPSAAGGPRHFYVIEAAKAQE